MDSVQDLARRILNLNARDLAKLNHILRDTPGWGTTGVREPRRPTPPRDSRGTALDPTEGKSEPR